MKAEDGDGEVKVEEQLDPNEEILLGSVPKANLVGLKYAGGIRTCTSLFPSLLVFELRSPHFRPQ